jgi:diamine N-acetyltransferase
VIQGERVRLRAIEREDLPRFVQWFNDPEVRENLDLFLPMSLVEEEKWFEDVLESDPIERPLAIDFLDGENWIHLGSCGLFSFNQQARHATLGISIGEKSYWDRGIGTDAMQTLLRHGFETLNLNRVYLHVHESNRRAIQVYQKLGFKEEGRLRDDRFAHGVYEDTLIMGVLRTEWKASNQEKA